MKILIVDYGLGNLRSVQYKLQQLGFNAIISSQPQDILNADKLILPGVGHFAKAMTNIKGSGLDKILNKKVIEEKINILGICLGMQLFSGFSEEGNVNGLGWLNAETKKFGVVKGSALKIPHMGWNTLEMKNESPLFKGIAPNSMYYFSHSYHIVLQKSKEVTSVTNYLQGFTSSLRKENIFGTQFHPEKSHEAGLEILRNFCMI